MDSLTLAVALVLILVVACAFLYHITPYSNAFRHQINNTNTHIITSAVNHTHVIIDYPRLHTISIVNMINTANIDHHVISST